MVNQITNWKNRVEIMGVHNYIVVVKEKGKSIGSSGVKDDGGARFYCWTWS